MLTEKIRLRNSLALLSIFLLVSSLGAPAINASALLSNVVPPLPIPVDPIPIPPAPETQTITNTINQTVSTISSTTNTINQTTSTVLEPISGATQTVNNILKPAEIILNNVQSTSGATSASNQIVLPSFNADTGANRTLVVGISANNNNAASVTFGGVPLTRAVSSFVNNNAEIWYLTNPSGTADIIVTMSGPTDAVVGAYAFSGVDQTNPIQTSATNVAVVGSSPSITIITKYPNDLVLDVPSIYGGSTLSSPTCTEQWNVNVPNAITGASSTKTTSAPTVVTCSWQASNAELWDDVAVELKASGTTIFLPGSPTAPTNLVATAISSSQINLSWTAPSSGIGNLLVTGYKIDRSTDGGNTWSTIVPNTLSTATTYQDTGLSPNTTYTYRVSSINALGTSPPSNTASATTQNIPVPTVPQPPTGLTATAVSSSQINLSWNAPSNNGGSAITGYKIERSTDGTTWSTIVSNTASTSTTYSNSGLSANTTYTYRVSAINAVGTSSPSNTSSATTTNAPTAPQPPTGLTATAVSSSQINLSWNAPSNNGGSAITGYKIERSTDGTTWSTIVSNTASTSTTYSNSGLSANTTYTYRVSAINAVGTSSPSDIASATTAAGSASGGITVFAHRIPANYWDPCFATTCDQGTGPGVTMWVALYDSSGNYLTGGFTDENGFTFTNLSSAATYYVYPTDCENCHGDPHTVAFQYWGDDQSNVRPRAATTGENLHAWYSCTNNCAGVP